MKRAHGDPRSIILTQSFRPYHLDAPNFGVIDTNVSSSDTIGTAMSPCASAPFTVRRIGDSVATGQSRASCELALESGSFSECSATNPAARNPIHHV
jgi:hypothetical protein